MTLSTAQRRAVTLSTLAKPSRRAIPGDRFFDSFAEISGGIETQFILRAVSAAHPSGTDHFADFVERKDAGFPGESRQHFRGGSGGDCGGRWNRDDAWGSPNRLRDPGDHFRERYRLRVREKPRFSCGRRRLRSEQKSIDKLADVNRAAPYFVPGIAQ